MYTAYTLLWVWTYIYIFVTIITPLWSYIRQQSLIASIPFSLHHQTSGKMYVCSWFPPLSISYLLINLSHYSGPGCPSVLVTLPILKGLPESWGSTEVWRTNETVSCEIIYSVIISSIFSDNQANPGKYIYYLTSQGRPKRKLELILLSLTLHTFLSSVLTHI
jgi:hypothetical protein